MFRTRDFVLFFTTIVFLVMAIGVTLFQQESVNRQAIVVPNTTNEITVTEVLVSEGDNVELDREARLASLRQKIEQSQLVSISAPEPEPSSEPLPEQSVASVLQLCPTYQSSTVSSWPVGLVKVAVTEGLRQYYTESAVSLGTTSSSTQTARNILLELPTLFLPFGDRSCIDQDVIGVALDGSLIRNTETGLYGVFGSETLIGYARDGFPIYGVGEAVVDECGGRIELGQYRYEISADRDTMLNCFADTPQTFLQ